MKRISITILLIAIICASIYFLGSIQSNNLVISPVYAASEVAVQQSLLDGRTVGDVLVNNEVIFRIRTSAGGYTPYERAQIVANRLQQLMGDSLQPEDITTGRVRGQEVVLAGGRVIVTADAAHARINNTTPMDLSNLWATRLENVVAGRRVTETPTAQKVVPIISVGRGVRVGGALVAGARDRLDDVVAVAQLEGQFGNSVRVRALIPVSTENVVQNIARVPETSVIGLVDIPL